MQGITPKKSYGQNFLNDKNIIHKIINLIDCKQDDLIIEIGPGNGALTEFLILEKVNLVAIEFDSRAVDFLNQQYPKSKYQNFELIYNDIRNIKLLNLLQKYEKKQLKVVGNIPYNISSDILFWLFEQAQYIDKAIIMFQKEVALRIVAQPKTKEYGIISIASDLVSNTSKKFDVSPSCFYPKPKVTSSVIEIIFDTRKYNNLNFKAIMKLVKSSFNQRRKVLKNSLKNYLNLNNIDLNQFINNNAELELLFKKRAEELSTENFIKLLNAFEQFK